MIIIQLLTGIFWLGIIPIVVGKNVCRQQFNNIEDYFLTYIWGMLIMFSVFEIITVPIEFMYKSLHLVTILWTLVISVFAILGIIQWWKDLSKNIWFGKKKWDILSLSTLGIVIFQTLYVASHTHIDDDDAWYVGTAVASYFTDTINRISPYTGGIMNTFPSDYTLSPYPVFWGMMGKLTMFHPAILMRTIVPLFFIPLSYCVYRLLAGKLLKEEHRKWFLFFLAVFNLFGNFSVRSVSTFLLTRIWQGKAVLCSILIPLLIYFFICWSEERKKKYWMGQLLTVVAGSMVSSMAVFLFPVSLGCIALITAVYKRTWKPILESCAILSVCVVQFGIYFFYLR